MTPRATANDGDEVLDLAEVGHILKIAGDREDRLVRRSVRRLGQTGRANRLQFIQINGAKCMRSEVDRYVEEEKRRAG